MENFLNACSGCAGDYEDPERSAWGPDEEEEEDAEEGKGVARVKKGILVLKKREAEGAREEE